MLNLKLPILALLLLPVCFFGCSPYRHLPKNSALVYTQEIKASEQIDTEKLLPFYRQKPNRRFFHTPWMPYLSAYLYGKSVYRKKRPADSLALLNAEEKRREIRNDTLTSARKKLRLENKMNKKIESLESRLQDGNWLMQALGEPPSVFDSLKADETARQMQLYLRTEGYFGAKVSASSRIEKRRAHISYKVKENLPTRIGRLTYQIEDSVLRHYILTDTAGSLIKTGTLYSERNLSAERDRLSRRLKETGYLYFDRSFIYFNADTLAIPADSVQKFVKIEVVIEPPAEGQKHRRMLLGRVNFISDLQGKKNTNNSDTVIYNRIFFYRHANLYSPSALSGRLNLRAGQAFSISHTEETQRKLAAMNIFKFINIRYDTLGGLLTANIYANSLPRYDLSVESGVNVSQSLPGPFFSLSWQARNIFGVADVLELSGRGSVEAQAGTASSIGSAYQSQEYSLNASLSLPFMLFPISQAKKDNIGIFNTRTRLLGGLVFTKRPEYTRFSMQSSFSYDWSNNRYSLFTVNLLNIGVVNTLRLGDDFLDYMFDVAYRGNRTLLLSFGRSLISNSSVSFTYNNTRQRNILYLRADMEAGGTYLNFLNNNFLESNPKFLGLQYFRYFSMRAEARYYLPIGKAKGRMLALRCVAGLARPYGTKSGGTAVLPFEKHFFTGGSNSVRAWRPRRLGPGSYTPPVGADGTFDYSYEQPGEIIIEANAEYRANLFGFVNGAVFVDAGNVWMSRSDARKGAVFEPKTFLTELAVGAGLGLRFDFSFIILRFDAATKILDPAMPAGRRFVARELVFSDFFNKKGQTQINIGIGYPF